MTSKLVDLFIFPAPNKPGTKAKATAEDIQKLPGGSLLWIPLDEARTSIPCLLFEHKGATHTYIFSHGNACDLYDAHEMYKDISKYLEVNFIVYEYPGYSCFAGTPSGTSINQTILAVNDFAVKELKVPQDTIVIFGQSIGSGPSCYLASELSKRKTLPAALILLSPYTSINDMVKAFAGRAASWLSKDHWNNVAALGDVACPTMFMHGYNDDVIPYVCSPELYKTSPLEEKKKKLVLMSGATHNNLDWGFIFQTIREFVAEHSRKKEVVSIVVPQKYLVKKEYKKTGVSSWILSSIDANDNGMSDSEENA
jgi:dienelactone hydrolase